MGVNLQRNYRSSSWSKWSCGKSWRENSSIWKVGTCLLCNVDCVWSRVPQVQNAPLNVPPSDLALGAPQIIFRIKWSVSCPTERKWSSSCRLFEVRLFLDYYLSHIDMLCRSAHFKQGHRKGRTGRYYSSSTMLDCRIKRQMKSNTCISKLSAALSCKNLCLFSPFSCCYINDSVSGSWNWSHIVCKRLFLS